MTRKAVALYVLAGLCLLVLAMSIMEFPEGDGLSKTAGRIVRMDSDICVDDGLSEPSCYEIRENVSLRAEVGDCVEIYLSRPVMHAYDVRHVPCQETTTTTV